MGVGIFGGVFNPPHTGHLICAQEALIQLGLETVVWVPVGEASHRTIDHDPGGEARFEMCERATAGDERMTVSRIELDRPGPSYTVDTLIALRELRPDQELFLIVGGDEAAALRAWREPEEVLRLATVAAVERDGRRREEIGERLAGLEGGAGVAFVEMPRVDISSSLLRQRAAAGQPIRYLVPDAVADYIRVEKLYRPPARVAAA